MSVEMAVWRMTESGPVQLANSHLDKESRLEELILKDPSMIGTDLLVIGSQVATSFGGFIDILAIDVDGRIHVLELKRDRTPRDVVAQALDYGAWVKGLSREDLAQIHADQSEGEASLSEAFAQHFGEPLPDVVNADQQLTIVASNLDPASDRIVEYLAESYGVPINAVFFRHLMDEDREYLARTWLIDPVELETMSRRTHTKTKPWNGRDFYVVLGRAEQGGDRWDFARQYGLLSAGGGSWYWKPLRNLTPGKRVLAYVGGAGYVGIGEVTGTMVPAREAKVAIDGGEVGLLDIPSLPAFMAERAPLEDPEKTEMVVPITWHKTRPIAEAAMEQGLFASQVTACRLRDERTIEFVEKAFGVRPPDEDEAGSPGT